MLEVLKAMNIKIMGLTDVTCSLVDRYLCGLIR
jgi:hypothetical protein